METHSTMINPPRSTRNSIPPSFPEEMDALTSFIDDKTLTPRSKLDEFRRFFDFKSEFWNKFHRQIKEHVLLTSTWAEMQLSETNREAVAATFLEQVGSEFWSKENQEKYLLEDHIKNGHVCAYPRDKKTMIKALAFLLEKDAKNRRGSVSQDVPQAQSSSSPLPDPPPSGCEVTATVKKSSSRASTPTRLFRIPKTPKTPKTPQATQSMRSTSVARESRTLNSPAPSTPTPVTRGLLGTVENARVSSAVATHAAPSHEITQLCCQVSMGLAENFFTQFSDIAPNTLATYFLVQEQGNQGEPVCVPFRNFEDYKTSDEFLDEMEKRCCEHDPSMLQLFEDVWKFSHAVVLLQWSGVSFMMRRETDDLQSLANRIGCAWRAKENGELQAFEFVIRVTLKKD